MKLWGVIIIQLLGNKYENDVCGILKTWPLVLGA